MPYINYLLAGQFRRLAFQTAGDPGKPALVCVHGLTRNAHDFDKVAEALSGDFYVVAPDLPGRGESDWLCDPMLYQPVGYIAALSHLLAWLDRPVFWLGTSLGGICGMLLAAAPNTPIRRLILNDVGPVLPAAALRRIAAYVKPPESFPTLAALETYLRVIHRSFVPMETADWHHMVETSSRPLPDGGFAMHYDPGIATAFTANEPQDVDLHAVYDAIRCPILAIRGEFSDILSEPLFVEMQSKGAVGWQVPESGHAPTLNDAESQRAIRRFLA